MEKLENVKIIFHSDYYDGPLDGICEYQGKLYRFDCKEFGGWCGPPPADGSDDCSYVKREYNVKEIEMWQLAYALYWHCLFITNCGQYYRHKDDIEFINERFNLPVIKNSQYHLEYGENFYQKQKEEYKKIDYSQNKIIGWFSD